MNIVNVLNEQLKHTTHKYLFVSIIQSSKKFDYRDRVEQCTDFKLRCISEVHKDFYDIINLQFCSTDIREVNMDKAVERYNEELIKVLAFSKETIGLETLQSTPVKTFRDIMKLISEDKPLSK
jgi:hypothetical protein